jgi:hypothetical protein
MPCSLLDDIPTERLRVYILLDVYASCDALDMLHTCILKMTLASVTMMMTTVTTQPRQEQQLQDDWKMTTTTMNYSRVSPPLSGPPAQHMAEPT